MKAEVSHLWRHPIKGYGTEAVLSAELFTGTTMPWDRVWAVTHQATRPEALDGEWAQCANYCRGARSPGLMAVQAETDVGTGSITLRHPQASKLTVDLSSSADTDRFLAWAQALATSERGYPTSVVVARDRGMTDSAFPSVSILNHASRRDLEQATGTEIDMRRFRGNIWLTGLRPWEEMDLVGRDLQVGKATLRIRQKITRCRATEANPATGKVDVDVLGTLKSCWGHQEFGLYGEVVSGGTVSVGDAVVTHQPK